jgi:hypothetical protein
MAWIIGIAIVVLLVEGIGVGVIVRRKQLDKWLPSYLLGMRSCARLNQPKPRPEDADTLNAGAFAGQSESASEYSDDTLLEQPEPRRMKQVSGHRVPHDRMRNNEELHVFIAVCDHYEPDNARPARHVADDRVNRWCNDYPQLFGHFEDSRGQVPQHSFFYPQDEYFVPGYLDQLKKLCSDGFGDVEIHLHHDNDTEDQLREKLESFRETLNNRHGLLRRDPLTGKLAYGFIHGNWALCNSRPDGRWCGVNDELTILRETGCYADFTMPSAPDGTQTRIINSVYYAASDARRPKSHNRGTEASFGVRSPQNHLLMLQGPLKMDWHARSRGVMPRIENGDLLNRRPPTWQRFQQWMKCGVHVAGRPDWSFVKLHTHGCKDGNIDTLLGEDTQQFHRDLAQYAKEHPSFRFYYVTAYEMAQMVHQAEAGIARPRFEFTTPGVELGVV